MADKNFIRKYELRAGVMGRNGFCIGQTTSKDPHALHVSFSIEKSTSETLNTAKVQIWNLSRQNLQVLDTKDCVIQLRAGYENHMALILVGNVVTSSTQIDGADRLTEIEVVDGRAEIRDTYISISYKGKTNAKIIFEKVVKELGLSVIYSKGCEFMELSNGFSYIGAAKNVLSNLCGVCNLTWSIQNQILHIRKPNEAITSMSYLLSSTTGLIDIPKRITIAVETGGDPQNQIGYEVRYLLNGAVGVNDYIRLESKYASGYFRVYKVTIDGDNLEGEWICTAQLLEVK